MRRVIKILIIITIILFILVITVDCIRLNRLSKKLINSPKPIITIKCEEVKNREIYYGLGYSIKYYRIPNSMGYGATFKLFNLVKIWSWEAL